MLKIPAVEIWGANLIADSVTLENLATTWDFAKSLNIGFLMEACINLMETQFIRLISDDLFVRLPGDTVLSLFQSEDLSVDSEEQVFEAISRWVCPCGVVDEERLNTYAPNMLKEVQWHQTTAQFREHLLDNHPIYQTNVECARLMAAVEQWIGAAATRRRMCPFNQHSRNGRTPQMIFVFGRDTNQDRWSVLRFDSELQNEERVADMELRRYATYSVVGVLSATHFRGRIIAAGGFDGNKKVNVVEIFSPPDSRCPLGQWTDLAAMNQPRTLFTLLTTRDAVFALGGGDGKSGNTVEALTATEGSVDHDNDLTSWIWSTKNPLEALAEIHGAVSVRM
nr:unnamed protein product [Spirometra erinaceieuropaei]